MSDRLEPPKRYDRRITEPEEARETKVIKSERKSFLPKSDILTLGGIDIPFFAIVIGLLTIGLVMLFSATYPYAYSKFNGDSYYYTKRQLIFMIIGIIVMLVVSKVNYQLIKRYTYPLLGVTLLLLVIVLFYHTNFQDFKRWIPIGPLTFQPSDLAKFTIIVVLADYISKNHKRMKHLINGVVYPLGIIAVFCVLIHLENHNSGMILVFLIGATLMFCGGTDWKLFALGAGVVVAVALFVVLNPSVLQEYAGERIVAWLDKDYSPLDARWQTNNSLYAIGSGGFFGAGLGNSKQKFMYVSEPQNDFIFSIVCEELGFIGATVIIVLFALLFLRGIKIAMNSRDRFATLVVIGIVSQVAIQVIFNILVVTDTIPNTGISLPFFSYGGTSLIMLLAEMGVVLSISRSTNQKKV
ncbi:MAG: putative lipid II flippase FtsW [Eubacterium sp.]|nr:putative lipid II flippase FtsW [Eubacterium sp.]